MNIFELLQKRFSANKFDTTKTLTKEQVEELIAAAGHAPSAYNMQHWRFVAVAKKEDKERLKSVAYNQQKVADASVTFIVLGDLRGHEKLGEILKPFVEQGNMTQEMADSWVKSVAGTDPAGRATRDEAIRSASMAAMVLMLAAEEKGLATGPMIGFDPEGVKREFQIPDRYVPAMLITCGYPIEGNWPQKPRLPLSEILFWDDGKGMEQ